MKKLTKKNLVMDPDPILRKRLAEVTFPLSEELKNTALLMREYVIDSTDEELAELYDLEPSVGIAACQIGVDARICTVYIDYEDDENLDLILINPKIMAHSAQLIYIESGEGCLSIPNKVPGYVYRYNFIKVKYFDIEGNEHIEEFEGYDAVVIQHEIDHLNGKLYYDYIDPKNPFKKIEKAFIL